MAIVVGFQCDVVGCELAGRGLRRGAAETSGSGGVQRVWAWQRGLSDLESIIVSVDRSVARSSRPTHSAFNATDNYYFASAAVAVDSSHMTASSYTLWRRFSPPSNFVNGHVSTVWFMVCR